MKSSPQVIWFPKDCLIFNVVSLPIFCKKLCFFYLNLFLTQSINTYQQSKYRSTSRWKYLDIQSEHKNRFRIDWSELLSQKTSNPLNQFLASIFLRCRNVLSNDFDLDVMRKITGKQPKTAVFTPFLTSILPSQRGSKGLNWCLIISVFKLIILHSIRLTSNLQSQPRLLVGIFL